MYNNYLRNCYFHPIIWGWETLVNYKLALAIGNDQFLFHNWESSERCVFCVFIYIIWDVVKSFADSYLFVHL